MIFIAWIAFVLLSNANNESVHIINETKKKKKKETFNESYLNFMFYSEQANMKDLHLILFYMPNKIISIIINTLKYISND